MTKLFDPEQDLPAGVPSFRQHRRMAKIVGAVAGAALGAVLGVLVAAHSSEGRAPVATPDQGGATEGLITGPEPWCVHDYVGRAAHGNPVVAWTCEASSSQMWTIEEGGRLKALGACMTADGGTGYDGALVVMGACSEATQWAQRGDNVVETASGLCLNASALGHESQFTLAWCNGGISQQWHLPSTSSDRLIQAFSRA